MHVLIEGHEDQDQEADASGRDRDQIMKPHQDFRGLASVKWAGQGVTDQLGHNQEPTVGPPMPLNEQRTEVGWRGAVGQPFGVVVQSPSTRHQVDR